MTRRTFLDILVSIMQAFVAGLCLVPVLRFVLHPLRANKRGGGFVRLVPLSSVAVGKPQRAVVKADKWDAFIHYPPGPVGSVWVLRSDDEQGEPRIRCLQTTCPHLGCAVDRAADGNGFHCPCHDAVFDGDGKKMSGPAPRDMDELEMRLTEAGTDGERWIEVNYQTFTTGVEGKIPNA